MKIGDKVKVRDSTGVIVKKDGNYILVRFEDGSQYCLNSLRIEDK
jgi:hypothetical protein